MIIDDAVTAESLQDALGEFWELSGQKIRCIREKYERGQGSPVFTSGGRYRSRGWTEWTQGFEFGSSILQFDATEDGEFLAYGRAATVAHMAPHLSHTGVHDHGFNNISTYGNLLRLMREKRIPDDPWEKRFYELALKLSGAVQAGRWTDLGREAGYIFSFNGPHSLFIDTIRSCRSLVVSHMLGHVLMTEGDQAIDLLDRAVQHLETTALYSVYYGENRDIYDVSGRVAHESVFNTRNGSYRCPSTQQGYSGFSTWTRGLAWAILGFAEQLEFFSSAAGPDPAAAARVRPLLLRAACATADFYIANSASDGIPHWDTGAPGLSRLGDYLNRPAEPFNGIEPVDSSAAAIASQGFLRLGRLLGAEPGEAGRLYWQAGLTLSRSLFADPYLSRDAEHQGLILHSVYHRPNGWDAVPPGETAPCGESSMWGDYHARETALLVQRSSAGGPPFNFFACACP